MRKLILFGIILILYSCQNDDEKCGQIIQKAINNSIYYFIIQTDNDSNNNYYDENSPGIPDDGIRQGSVSEEIYNSFEIGDEYCSEI
ncbi:MAG: hypothetical protein HN562_01525 [Flavobacteriaceae bacterium]|jgi:hypothetical protein|nr:hypothetical protein [Flavobacteriaceae bacterium]MDA9586934.1 hypothetical protein [Flavobacteriaceae bacterium]MDA9630385.1 hypothetical protein [Flavobacteriaceae bacterium]